MCGLWNKFTLAIAVGMAVASAEAAVPQNPQAIQSKPIPSVAEMQTVVAKYFAAQQRLERNDLITRDQIEPLLNKLRDIGLPLPDAKQMLSDAPVKGEFLVEQLSTPAGRKFMRQISGYPDAYDRLDRMSRMPHGKQTIRDLIRGPGGYEMIKYMTTTPGGYELGRQLANSPAGKGFDDPTGRIYTMDMLFERLVESRAASLKAAGKSTAQNSP